MQENKMGIMPVKKLVLNMSLPMMASMLVQAMYNIVDSVFVSQISEQALTAVSLAFPAQNLMIGLATGTGVGINALLSRALGARDHEGAKKAAENGLLLACVGYLVFLVFGLFFSRTYFAAQTDVTEIIDLGVQYLTICCGLSFGIYGEVTFERFLQSTGRTVYTMVTQGVGAVLNLVFDPIFIFVMGWGVAGAAAATVLGQIVAMCLGIYLNHHKNPEIRLSLRGFKPDLHTMGRIYAIGFPSVLMVAIGSVMTFFMNKILIVYTAGKETTATVFGVYFKLNSFVFMPLFGLNNGLVPIIAYNYGAQKRGRMMEAIRFGTCLGVALMLFGCVVFELLPRQLLSIFDASPNMIAIGVPALRIIGATFPFAGVCIVLGSVFQSLGKSTYSLLTSFLRQLVALLPAAYVLARVGMAIGNNDLVWWSYPFAELVSLAATLLCFRRIYRTLISRIPEDGLPGAAEAAQ
ncbi:MAG: MATE family efflux transporter [Oscillospiraceae bacterium]